MCFINYCKRDRKASRGKGNINFSARTFAIVIKIIINKLYINSNHVPEIVLV